MSYWLIYEEINNFFIFFILIITHVLWIIPNYDCNYQYLQLKKIIAKNRFDVLLYILIVFNKKKKELFFKF